MKEHEPELDLASGALALSLNAYEGPRGTT
jgi:hypothetical protein